MIRKVKWRFEKSDKILDCFVNFAMFDGKNLYLNTCIMNFQVAHIASGIWKKEKMCTSIGTISTYS